MSVLLCFVVVYHFQFCNSTLPWVNDVCNDCFAYCDYPVSGFSNVDSQSCCQGYYNNYCTGGSTGCNCTEDGILAQAFGIQTCSMKTCDVPASSSLCNDVYNPSCEAFDGDICTPASKNACNGLSYSLCASTTHCYNNFTCVGLFGSNEECAHANSLVPVSTQAEVCLSLPQCEWAPTCLRSTSLSPFPSFPSFPSPSPFPSPSFSPLLSIGLRIPSSF